MVKSHPSIVETVQNQSLKQKKGLRGSVDKVLANLLSDEDDGDNGQPKVRSTAVGSGRSSSVIMTNDQKHMALRSEEDYDDFFSKLAAEANGDDEVSEGSEVDPTDLLANMNMDDLEADLFSTKKPSSAPAQRNEPLSEERTTANTEENKADEKKPCSAPASTARTYKKFSFLESEEEKPRDVTPAAEKTRRKELTFDGDGEDLMESLGFGDAAVKRESAAAPHRPRTRLEEILSLEGRGTSPRLLERPGTGEQIQHASPKHLSRSARSTDTPPVHGEAREDEEQLIFGGYQPSVSRERRQTLRSSIRRSSQDASRSDWLGLTHEEVLEESAAKDDERQSSGRSRVKAQPLGQSEEKERKQDVISGVGQEVELDALLRTSKPSASPASVPAPTQRKSREEVAVESPADGATAASLSQSTRLPADRTHTLLQTQSQLLPRDWMSERVEAGLHCSDVTSLQKRISQLEGQVRSLELEREQSQTLMLSLQQRHTQDTQMLEDTHSSRVRLLEDCFTQREQRLRRESEELAERLAAAEQERRERQEQQQRRLTQCQQERDRDVERLRELQRRSILEMKQDHEEQIQHLKKLKAEEIDAVTSATSQTRSLAGVIQQMELFSRRLGELSSLVETSHENAAQGLELGARQRDQQLRGLQEQLSQQQRDMSEERARLAEVIAKMDVQLSEQQRQLERERWRVTSEQAKAESAQRGLEDERRTVMQHISMEREELERAKSALLEEQQTVMQRCGEERRALAEEWSRFHTQEKRRQQREEREASQALKRDATHLSMAQEQAELKLKEEVLQREREELEREKERVRSATVRLKTRAQEVEGYSQLASQQIQEAERMLKEARSLEAEHQSRLRSIHAQTERLRLQEKSLQQERLRTKDHHHRERLRHTLPIDTLTSPPLITGWSAPLTADLPPAATEFQARLALIKHGAEKDRDFLQEEQIFLDGLKKPSSRAV